MNIIRMTDREWSANLWSRIKALFGGLDARVTALEQGGGGGGEVNVIESISLNGTNVPPDSNKKVALVEADPTVPSWAKATTKPTYTASEVGAIATSQKGVAGGVAELNSNGLIPNNRLPVATSSTVGGIKVGDGLAISNGVLSVSLPNADVEEY